MKFYIALPLSLALLGSTAIQIWAMKQDEGEKYHGEKLMPSFDVEALEKELNELSWKKPEGMEGLYRKGKAFVQIVESSDDGIDSIFQLDDVNSKIVISTGCSKESGVKEWGISLLKVKWKDVPKKLKQLYNEGKNGKIEKIERDLYGTQIIFEVKNGDEVWSALYPYLVELGFSEGVLEDLVKLHLIPEVGESKELKALREKINEGGDALTFIEGEGLEVLKKDKIERPSNKHRDKLVMELIESLKLMGSVGETAPVEALEDAKQALKIMRGLISLIDDPNNLYYIRSRTVFANFVLTLPKNVMSLEERYREGLKALFEAKNDPEAHDMLKNFTNKYINREIGGNKTFDFTRLDDPDLSFDKFWGLLNVKTTAVSTELKSPVANLADEGKGKGNFAEEKSQEKKPYDIPFSLSED